MLKTILTACAVSAALLASHVTFAQTDTAGESRAAPSKSATKDEKAAAKQKRRSSGKETAAKGQGHVDDKPETAGTAKVSKDEKAQAKASRKKSGAETAKKGSAGGEAATMGTK